MSEQTDDNRKSSVQASDNSNVIGGNIEISSAVQAGGNVQIGHTIGYTSEQVSALITQIQTTFQLKPFDGRCPYKGLDVFEEEDAELFFGREKLVEDLIRRAKESRTVFVTGPSGSGKSSLVRAGLIHALKQGAVKESHSENWLYATMRPGRDPFEALAGAFARLKSPEFGDYVRANASKPVVLQKCAEAVLSERKDQRLVLFMDQFEETFTQLSADKARTFIETISYAATIDNGRVILLFSMRSDFVSNCAMYPQLNSLLNQQFVQIGAMQPEELVSAIAQPALRVGLKIDADLIAQIINDMEGEPGSLPLMQFALKDLFDSQQAKGGLIALTLNDYLQRGGIRKALERHADNSFSKLNAHEQELARNIFSGLIEIGRGTQDTKRTALFDELVPANTISADVETIVRKLADARLVTTDEAAGRDTVTISHEKLIDAWPWLKRLVNENRDVIALQNEISADAKEWDEHERDASYLYTGGRLFNVREKLSAKKLVLSGLAKDFIDEGIRVGDAERKSKEVLRRRIIAGLVSGIASALILAGFAVYQMLQAQKQAKISRIGELAAQSVSLRDTKFQISLLLGVEAINELDEDITSVQAQSVLLENSQANPRLEQYLNGNTDRVVSAIFSPDGKTLASGTYDKDIILWDMKTHQPIDRLIGHTSIIRSIAFNSNGSIMASGSEDKKIILWNMKTGQPIYMFSGHLNAVTSVAFSPDGKILASGSCGKKDENNLCIQGEIILWDARTGQSIRKLNELTDIVRSVAFSPDGKILASGSDDGMIILWDVKTGESVGRQQIVYTHHMFGFDEDVSSAVLSVAFSPDGNTLASGDYDNNVTLWDVQTSELSHKLTMGRHSDIVRTLTFSPDGKTLASGSADKTIILWDAETGKFLDQLNGHSDIINSLSFSPDSSTLASGSADTTIILWNMNQRQRLARPLSGYIHSGQILGIVFSPDGKILASGSEDKTIMLWDVEKGQAYSDEPLFEYMDAIRSISFSPDGKTLAIGSSDGSIILWDVKTRMAIVSLSGHTASVNSMAFSPDGRMLASGSDDKTIILWDEKTGRPVDTLGGHLNAVTSVAFSPDGKTLASGSVDTTVMLWNLETHQAIVTLSDHSDSITSLAFSPDGNILASGSEDTTIILWDVKTHQAIVILSDHSDSITSLAFSPDGKKLASGSLDGSVILWDVKTHQLIGALSGGLSFIRSIAFSPDSKTLASSSTKITLWDSTDQLWIDISCRRAGRNFTPKEWEFYFPAEELRKVCPQFPLEPEATLTGTP